MATCHTDRPHHAKGLCSLCYMQQYDRNRAERNRKDPSEYASNYRVPPVKPPRVPDCHPDRKHEARGLCNACYQKEGRKSGPKLAACHPDRPALARGLCHQCYARERYWDDPKKFREEARRDGAEKRKRLRDEMVATYGGRCACANCPETNSAFLTLDHINGDGKAHRMKMGSHTYADLRRQGWPTEGYRLLCWNCNAMTRGGRMCPHEEGA